MKKFAYFIFSLIVLFHTSLEAKESVYYLHGFMRSSSSMKRMVKPFQNQGYKTYLWDYPSHRQTIEEHAKTLIQELQEATKQDPGLPIHFITHSLGGIILRAALNSPDCPEEAKKGNVVLLSPPNQGSSFARNLNNIGFVQKLFGKKAGKQLLTSQNFDHLGFVQK